MVQFGVAQQASAINLETTPHGFFAYFLGLHETQSAEQAMTRLVEVDSHMDNLSTFSVSGT